MRATAIAAVAMSFLGLLWGFSHALCAEPVLERLQQSIRGRDYSPTAPAPGAEKPGGESRPGYLGVLADDKNDRGRGVRIVEVRPQGPAEGAGLKANDLITAIAGTRVRQMSDMAEILAVFAPGDTIVFDVLREDKPQQVKVTLGQRPAAKEPAAKEPAAEAVPPIVPRPVEGVGGPGLPFPLLPAEPPPTGPEPAAPKIAVPAVQDRVEQLQRQVEQLQQQVKQLEVRLAEMEKALSEAKKKQ